MNPHCEVDDDDKYNPNGFWDWYVIGGRWDNIKEISQFDEGTMDAFWAKLQEEKVTVSGIQTGHQKLEPTSQEPMVDEMFREFSQIGKVPVPCLNMGHEASAPITSTTRTLSELGTFPKISLVSVQSSVSMDEIGDQMMRVPWPTKQCS